MNARNDVGSKIGAFALIGLGIFFLLTQLGVISFSFIGAFWPFFIIVPGLAFVFFAMRNSKELASLMIPGAIVTGTGAILLYQNLTNHWESWAYAWTLYPIFLGLGQQYLGRRTGNDSTENTGRGFVRWGGFAFLAAAIIFELFIFNSFAFSGVIIPVVLIVIGALMLLRGGRSAAPRKRKIEDDPVFSGAAVTNKRKPTRLSASDDLRRRIDDALAAEDDPSQNGIITEQMEPEA